MISLLLTAAFAKEILLVVEISRHGARAPKKIYDLTLEDNFEVPYNLT
jgi:hypothetical protein